MFVGRTRRVLRAGARPSADEEAASDAEGDPRLALSSQVPKDAVELRDAAGVHACPPQLPEIPTGKFVIDNK